MKTGEYVRKQTKMGKNGEKKVTEKSELLKKVNQKKN